MILEQFNQMKGFSKAKILAQKASDYKIYLGIFLIFFIPRIIDLGTDMSNYDASYWYPRMNSFIKNLLSGEYQLTYQKYHPGVILLWLSGFSEYAFQQLFQYLKGYDPSNLAQQFPKINFVSIFPLVVTISLLSTATYHYIRKLSDARFALLYCIILSLEPFFLGVSKYLHLSALGAAFCYLSFVIIYYHYQSKQISQKLIYISAILAGLAVLTKIDSLIGLAANYVIILIFEFQKPLSLSNKIKNILVTGIIYTVVIFTTFYMLFPAMWAAPVWVLEKMYSEGILDTAFNSGGEATISGNDKLFYLEFLFLRTLPTTFVLLLCGIIASFVNFKKSFISKNVIYLGIFYFFFFMGLLMIPEKTKDRYISNFFPAMAIVSAYGWYTIEKSNKYAKYFIWIVAIFMYALTAYRYHPVYSMYYTDLIGGPSGMAKFNVPVKNRGEFYAQAAMYINKTDSDAANRNAVMSAPEHIRTFKPFFYGNVYANPKVMPENKKADYIITSPELENLTPLEFCTFEKAFGPKSPLAYDAVKVYKCKNLTNKYKDYRN